MIVDEKLPLCPICEQDALWLEQGRGEWRVICQRCTFDSGIHFPGRMLFRNHIGMILAVFAAGYRDIARQLQENLDAQ